MGGLGEELSWGLFAQNIALSSGCRGNEICWIRLSIAKLLYFQRHCDVWHIALQICLQRLDVDGLADAAGHVGDKRSRGLRKKVVL